MEGSHGETETQSVSPVVAMALPSEVAPLAIRYHGAIIDMKRIFGGRL